MQDPATGKADHGTHTTFIPEAYRRVGGRRAHVAFGHAVEHERKAREAGKPEFEESIELRRRAHARDADERPS